MTKAAEESFASHRRFFWLWTVVACLAVLGGVFLYNQPIGGRNGGTTLGLAYGGLALAGIFWLMWYGVRKRYSYASGTGTLKGWLAAHVWIGVGLALLVPLHSGLHVGMNVHSAPYALMVATIASGIWGAYAYVQLPSQMEARREGVTMRSCAEQIEKISREMLTLTEGKSEAFLALAARVTVHFQPSLVRILFARPYLLSKEQLSGLLPSLPKPEYQAGLELTRMATRRLQACNQLISESSVVARLRIWLYLHLPLSFACLAAVFAHVFWALSYRWSAR